MQVRIADIPCWCWLKDHPLIAWCIANVETVQFIASGIVLAVAVLIGYIARKRTLQLRSHLKEVTQEVERTHDELNSILRQIEEYHPKDHDEA